MRKKIFGVTLECLQGNIVSQEGIGAVVNAANAQLRSGGGVAGAIHKAAGPELEKECRRLAPIKPGEAVITGGHSLPNPYIIHCLGPVYGVDKPESLLLGNCYRNAMLLADKHKIASIAFPAISTGIFGYPLTEAVEVALSAVAETTPQLKYVSLIRFVLFSKEDFDVYNEFICRTSRK